MASTGGNLGVFLVFGPTLRYPFGNEAERNSNDRNPQVDEGCAVIALHRSHFALLAVLYVLAMIYSSVVLGPAGLHYVPISLGEAWDKFLALRYIDNGSNQRPDWIANLLMTIPLSVLINSAVHHGSGRTPSFAGATISVLISFAVILAIKYLQLFFPPRTVTLNYITAQTIGAVLGVILFGWTKASDLRPWLIREAEAGEGLSVVLAIYTAWVFAFVLMPFDFVLSQGDLLLRALELPRTLFSLPGAGRPPSFRALILIADTLAMAPVGMFLAVRGRDRSTFPLLLRGFWLMVLMTLLQSLVLSAEVRLLAIAYRTIGVYLGILFIAKIHGKDLRKRHYYFSQYVPLAAILYVLAVAYVSALFSSEWIDFDEALNRLEPWQLLPFWNFYIVSKAQATASVVAHLAIYAPIGVMVWLRRGFWGRGATFAGFLAFGLSMLMEIGRWLKPDLRPDFSDPVIAAIGAAAAFKSMPYLWRMFEREAMMSGTLDTYIAQHFGNVARGLPIAPDEAEASAPTA
jgi:VanZ family protein